MVVIADSVEPRQSYIFVNLDLALHSTLLLQSDHGPHFLQYIYISGICILDRGDTESRSDYIISVV